MSLKRTLVPLTGAYKQPVPNLEHVNDEMFHGHILQNKNK